MMNYTFVSCRSVWRLKTRIQYRVPSKIYDIVKGPYLSMPETSGCWRQPDKRSAVLAGTCRGRGCGIAFWLFFSYSEQILLSNGKPYLQEGDRWVLDQVRLGASSWRKENLVLTSLAIHFNSVVLYLYFIKYKSSVYCFMSIQQTTVPFISSTA
jgi:hypothetical protein